MTGPMTSNGREWKTESFKRAMFFLHHKVLKSIMLRRTKKERASEIALPPKTVLIRWDILDTVEEDHYNGFYFDTVDKIQRYILQRDILDFDRVFSLLTHLRQVWHLGATVPAHCRFLLYYTIKSILKKGSNFGVRTAII